MAMREFSNEREGQVQFYKDYLNRVDSSLKIEDIISDSNDGVLRGNLLEFKLVINDLNSTLFQAVKYLSARRIKGKPIPKNILLISLKTGVAHLYHSKDYIDSIEKVYTGGASKGNEGFIGSPAKETLHYAHHMGDENRLISLLREDKYTKINIDENCIVGWATSFYRLNPGAEKAAFIGDTEGKVKIIGEIREPEIFKEYIHPYTKHTNTKFRYLMDRLNDNLQKKNLGAFYTPTLYAKKSLELVRKAIARVPEGNDYIILDRCAGTGNLEYGLTDDELSHVIVSTIEYYEYKVLLELLGDKVRAIIPPTEKENTFYMGTVRGADALSKEYIENPEIIKYVNDPQCTIILFENPPYAETTSIEHQKKGVGKKSSLWKQSYVVSEMKKEIKGTASNDLGNAFIWSAFKYYLRQPTDSYIVYSPVKYWKVQHLINQKVLGGFAFNRRYFHTNIDACIMVALYSKEPDTIVEFDIDAFDIDPKTEQLIPCGKLAVRRIKTMFSQVYYDKRVDPSDTQDGVLLGYSGVPARDDVKISLRPTFNDNIIGYMVIDGSNFDNPDLMSVLIRTGLYKGHGFFLRLDNYLEKLPMFAASRYITYNKYWTERARIMKSADGSSRYFADVKSGKLNQFLLRCLLFTTLETQNHMRSFTGRDGRFYRNEICLDTSNGDTQASKDIASLEIRTAEKNLLDQWKLTLESAKKTSEYDPSLTYGVYQIIDLNTFYIDEDTGIRVYNYNDLNGNLTTLKALVKQYYNAEIVPTLFEYEFLK